MFSPGVIQYCYTYINRYGQQSNIINVSSLFYLTHSDRGSNAEDKVNNSFEITIENPDKDFDMVRLYSIHRTSLNAVPIVMYIEDLYINKEANTPENNKLTYVDTGVNGSTIDPTELLFIGGKEITALTMVEKDNTLFLGNISQKNQDISLIQDYIDSIKYAIHINYHNGEDSNHKVKTFNLQDPIGNVYSNTFTLNKDLRNISTFKGGDYYRFGFQLQKYTGEWSEPIFIDDVRNDKYPRTSMFGDEVNLVYADSTISLEDLTDKHHNFYFKDFEKIYKRIRPIISFIRKS